MDVWPFVQSDRARPFKGHPMSSAKLGMNGAKAHYGCNNTRPGGASALASSGDAELLLFALETGNRQTRRLARKNLQKMQRKAIAGA